MLGKKRGESRGAVLNRDEVGLGPHKKRTEKNEREIEESHT